MSFVPQGLFEKASAFIHQYFEENGLPDEASRLQEIIEEIGLTGTYTLQEQELIFGAKLAWRNSNRCIGRLFWKSLKVRDRRHLQTESEVFSDILDHLNFGYNQGKIRPVITVYSKSKELTFKIWNKQIIRYAGYIQEDGSILGDPDSVEFTRLCLNRGWKSSGSAFDVLPVVIQKNDEEPQWFTIPEHLTFQIELKHTELPILDELKWKWYALPVISDMRLEVGGLSFFAAPFNGWYMLTEIAVRNLGDAHRYNFIPKLAQLLGYDTSHTKTLWRDKVLVVLMEMVLESFQRAGVTLVDHHTASEQFLEFCRVEKEKGREIQAEWSWIVPPTAGSTMGVFHQEWSNDIKSPNFFYQEPGWIQKIRRENLESRCPYALIDQD